jgi:Spy/CpxP family protein refolding chaperone
MNRKLILIALVAASAAFGQRGGGGGGRGGGRGGDSAMPMSFAPKNKLEQMTETLQLSKEQKKDVKTLMDDAQKQAAPLKEQISKSLAAVAEAVAAGKQDEVDKVIAANSELEAKMAAIEMQAFAGIYKILDPDQRTKSRGVFVMMPGIFKAKNWADAE